MKLHLPLSLRSALLALFVGVTLPNAIASNAPNYEHWITHDEDGCRSEDRSILNGTGSKSFTIPETKDKVSYEIYPEVESIFIFEIISNHESTYDEKGKIHCKVTYEVGCDNIGGNGGGADVTWECSKYCSEKHGVENVFMPGVWIFADEKHTDGDPITFSNYGDMVVDSSRQEYAIFKPVAYGPVYEVEYKSYKEAPPMDLSPNSVEVVTSVGFDLLVKDSKSFTYKNAYTEGSGSFVYGNVDVEFSNVSKVQFISNKAEENGLISGKSINFTIKDAQDVVFSGNSGNIAAIAYKNQMSDNSSACFTISEVTGKTLISNNTAFSVFRNIDALFYDNASLVFDGNKAQIFTAYLSTTNIDFVDCGEVVFSNNVKDVDDGLLFASQGNMDVTFSNCEKLEIKGNSCIEYLFSAAMGSHGEWTFENVSNVNIAENTATDGVLLNGTRTTVSDLVFTGVSGTFSIHDNTARNSNTSEDGYIYAGICGTDIKATGVGDGNNRADEFHFDKNYVEGCLRNGMVNGVLGAKWFDKVTFSGNVLWSENEGKNTMIWGVDFSEVGDVEICNNVAVVFGSFESFVGVGNESKMSSISSLLVKGNQIGLVDEDGALCPYVSSGILGDLVVTGADSGDAALSGVEISSNKIYGYATNYSDGGLKVSDFSSLAIKDNLFHAVSEDGEHSAGIFGRAEFRNVGDVEISNNRSISDSGRAFGSAIGSGFTSDMNANMHFILDGAGDVTVRGNSATGKDAALGGAIYSSWGISISNCENVEICDNFTRSTVIADLSKQEVRDAFGDDNYLAWDTKGAGAYGGALFVTLAAPVYGIHMSLLNNQSFVSRSNYVTDGTRYILQGIALVPGSGWSGESSAGLFGGSNKAYFGVSEGGTMSIYDSMFIGGDLNIGVDYENKPDEYSESDRNKGVVVLSGKYVEDDLKKIKSKEGAGAVTQEELNLSRTHTVTGSLRIYQGGLEVCDGAVLNVEEGVGLYDSSSFLKVSQDSTVAFAQNDESELLLSSFAEGTVWLNGGTLIAAVENKSAYGIGMLISGTGILKVTAPSVLKTDRLTLAAGATLSMELSASNAVQPALTLVANGLSSSMGLGIGVNRYWNTIATPAYLNLSTSGSLTAGDYILVHLTGDNMSNVGHVEGMNWIGGEGVSGLGAKDSLKWRTNADGTLDLVWTIGSDIVSLVRPATTLTWSGGEGVWAVKAGGDANVWTGSVEDLNFYDGDTVEFNSAATVTVEGNVAPAAINVSNADGTVTIEGAGQIQGAGKLTKTGNGTLALNTRNAYTGGTELNGGTIEVGDSYVLGLGEVQLKSGKLDLGGCGVGNTIKATGGTLAGAGDYAGMLLVNGELALEGDVSAAGGVGLVSGKISGGSIKDSLIAADGGELASTIIGSSSVTAQEGKVTISGDNSYSGGTTISGAELTVKHANALGSGAISATGTSSLIVDGVTLAPAKAISNSGTLTISGKFDGSALSKVAADDVRIDDLGVENATSGFLRTGNYTVTLVEGGTVNSSVATLSYNGTQLNLVGGVGYGIGTVDYSKYLLTGSDSATVSKITAAAGAALTGIDMQGGTLTVDESTNLITAMAGSIALTGGTMGGSIGGTTLVTVSGDATISGTNSYTGGTTISGAELTITNASALGSGAIVTNGTSSLTIGSGVTLVLTDAITNSGNLSLSGNFNIDALKPSGEVPSVRVALDGTEGESGFVKTAGYSLQVVSGGSVIDDAATISHNGKTVELDGAGVAIIEGGINYTQYHIASGHIAGVTDIVAAATAGGVTLAGISLAEGGTLNADASVELTADGGTIDLSAGTLSGTLKDVQMAATAGEITGTFSGTKSTLTGSNFVLGSTALKNDGTLALNGSFVADALSSELTNVDVRVDENGTAGGTSGFLRTGDFTVTLVEGGTVNSSSATVQYKGQQLEMSGGVGFGVGTVDYSNYLLAGSDSATVSKITAAAGAALTGIDMQGGTLTVDESIDLITATAGSIALTGGTMGGSIGGITVVTVSGDATISGANSYTGGTTISGAELTITNASALGSGAIVTNGTSSLTIGSGVTLALTEAVTNSGDLSLSGNFNIDALSSMGEIPSVRVNLSGVEGESGFLKTGSYNVQVVQGGTVNDAAATITRNDVAVTLDDSGVAFIEGRTDFTQYHVASGHEVDVQSVIAKSSAEGASLQDMSLRAVVH